MNVGFIGMGAVARVFSQVIASAPDKPRVFGYDVRYPGNEKQFEERFEGVEVTFLGSLKDLVKTCDLLFSAVTTDVALQVAQQAVEFMTPDKTYVDLNSMSPNRKKDAAQILQGKGRFIEAAVLGAVGATGAKTKILVCGQEAEEVARLLRSFGMQVSAFGEEIGRASLFKMVRSVFSKGLETLVIEFLVAAQKAGIYEDVWGDIVSFMSSKPFEDICENWVKSHTQAAQRRYFEMEQVVGTLRELGVKPRMAQASLEVFGASVDQNIQAHFTKPPEDIRKVTEFLGSSFD